MHQNAWFYMGALDEGKKVIYNLKDFNNGVYAFTLDGRVTIDGQELSIRDGMGLWDTGSIDITATSNARILLMEVSMKVLYTG